MSFQTVFQVPVAIVTNHCIHCGLAANALPFRTFRSLNIVDIFPILSTFSAQGANVYREINTPTAHSAWSQVNVPRFSEEVNRHHRVKQP